MKKLFGVLVVLLIAVGFSGGWLISNSQAPAAPADRAVPTATGSFTMKKIIISA